MSIKGVVSWPVGLVFAAASPTTTSAAAGHAAAAVAAAAGYRRRPRAMATATAATTTVDPYRPSTVSAAGMQSAVPSVAGTDAVTGFAADAVGAFY